MKPTRFIPPLFALLALLGCGDITSDDDTIRGRGPVVFETRPVGRFFAVANSTLADIEILQGSSERLRISAQENLLPYLHTRVDDNVLRITTTPGVILSTSERVLIELDLVELVSIRNSGSGDIRAPVLDAFDLEVVTSGSGDIDLPQLLADTLIVFSSGSGRVTGTGEVIRERLVVSGSGTVDLRSLRSLESDVTMSGSAPVTIRVVDRLRAVLSGSGTLRYYGSPQVTQTVTGTGRVERAGS